MATYDSSNIKNLQFPDSVRMKPGMYIGATDASGILSITRELLDNSVDEALAGRCEVCGVFLEKDGTIWTYDDGSGIPAGMTVITNPADNSKTKVPTLRAVYGVLHTSGKFNDEAYQTSRGTHGIGAKATNALSTEFEVWTFNAGKWWHVLFHKGLLKKDVVSIPRAPMNPATGRLMKKGTLVRFIPDKSIFSSVNMPRLELFEWAKMSAYLTPGLVINLTDAKVSPAKERSLTFPGGVTQYLDDRLEELRKKSEFGVMDGPAFSSSSNPLYDCALRFTSVDGFEVRAYTNGLLNSEGGNHQTSMLNALKEALQPYAGKKQEFTLHELKDGLVGLINVKLSSPKFDSQTKEKLVDERALAPVKEALLKEFTDFFKKNKKLAAAIIERATKLRQLKTKFVASKQMLTKLRKISAKGLPAKGATAPRCKPEDRELYLLEGDSAAGGMRFARYEDFQEFLPLKGKPKNVVRGNNEKKRDSVLESEEILNVFAMLGFDPKLEDPYSKLRVGKIILMADSDPDGHHIVTLLCAIFYRFLPELFAQNRIFVSRVPEYYSVVGTQIYCGDSLEEVQQLLVDHKVKGSVNHVKGYGEISSDLLRIFACNPASRRLYRVQPAGGEQFELLMGNDTTTRKQLLGI